MSKLIYGQWAENLTTEICIPSIDISKCMISYIIETTIDHNSKTIVVEQRTGNIASVLRSVAETKESHIRKGLIALGWTPPPRIRWWHKLFNPKREDE